MGISGGGRYDDTVNSDFVAGALTISTTETLVNAGASNLANRQLLMIFNDGNKTVYFGPTGVTAVGASRGIPIENGETVIFPLGDAINLYLVTQSGTSTVVVQEYS